MSAAHASGIAAQYIGAAGGSLPPVTVEALLRAFANHPNGNKKQDAFYGYGVVDATPSDKVASGGWKGVTVTNPAIGAGFASSAC
jgi:hypothetical protein